MRMGCEHWVSVSTAGKLETAGLIQGVLIVDNLVLRVSSLDGLFAVGNHLVQRHGAIVKW